MKKVLILTSDAGFGHRKASEAISAALQELYPETVEVSIVNPINDPDIPNLIRRLETGYDDMVMDDPNLYRLWYNVTDAPVMAQLMQEVTTTAMNKTLIKVLYNQQPDVVLSTHPSYNVSAMRALQQVGAKYNTPVHVVVTDLVGVHALWFNKAADYTFVPTGAVYKLALDNGLDKRQVKLTGLPVHPGIARETRPIAEIREALGWKTDQMTALVVGSARSTQTAGVVQMLDRSGLELQIAAVSGGDAETEAKLRALTWKSRVHVYGHVNNLPEMMKAADFVVCKAGGLIVSESLACGKPLALFDALPGQEIGNVKYVTESGAGDWSPGPVGVLTTVVSWLAHDGAELKKRRAMARKIGKPRAAYEIAELIMSSAENPEMPHLNEPQPGVADQPESED